MRLFIEDIKQTYLQVIQDLYDAGLRTLQVDDCTWGVLVDDNFLTAWGAAQGKSKDEVRRELADLFLTFNNDVYQHVPAGLTVNTHVCHWNFHSTWASSGGYRRLPKNSLEKKWSMLTSLSLTLIVLVVLNHLQVTLVRRWC